MPVPLPGQTLDGWNTTLLTKFVKDILEHQPPTSFNNIEADELVVNDKLTLPSLVSMPSVIWHAIGASNEAAFTNSWTNSGGSNQEAQYAKDVFNWIHLTGLIHSGTVNSSAFTLPPGFRPGAALIFPAYSNAAFGAVQVGSDGTVTPITPSSNVSVSLDGIAFKAA